MAVSSIKFKISVDTKELSSSLKSAQSAFQSTANSAKSSSGILSGLGNGLKGIGTAALNAVSKVGKLALSVTVFKAVNSSINLVTSSVSGAIKRIDTLNNSTRVFENMGYSADQSSKMMKNLVASIKGLPTGLDSAVQGVQLLAAATGNLDKSQKVFSAINNGILGFGGNADMVNNAIIQLSQSFANGKVDAQTWNSMINSGMGVALKELASNMGITMGQLKESLSDGTVSIEDFQDALIDLNENGSDKMASLKQIALDSTKGISTSFENMKTAVTRGVGEVIKGVDKLLQELTGKGISDWITFIGEQFESKLNDISGVLETFADPIKSSFGTLEKVFAAIQGLAETTWESLSTSAESLGGKFGSVLGSVASFIVDNMDTIESIVSTTVEVVTGVMLGIGDAIEAALPFFEDLVSGIGDFINGIKDMLPEGTSLTDFVRDLTPLLLKALIGFKILKGGIGLASGAFKTFNKVFDGITKFRTFISAVKGGARAFQSLSPAAKVLASTFKLVGSAVKVLSSVFMTAFKAIGTAVMAHPIIAAIVAIIAIIVLLWTKCEWFRDGVIAVWNYLIEAWIVGVQAIGEWLSNLGQTIVEKWEEIKTATAEAWDNIKEFFAELWEGIVTKVSESVEAIGNFISEKWEAITTTTSETWNSIKEFFAELWDGIVAKVSEVVGKIVSFISEKWEAVSTATTDTWNTIKEFFVVLWDDIVAKVSEIVGKIVSFISEKWEDIKRTTSEIWEKIKTKVSDAIQGAKDKVADTVDSIKRNVSEKWNEVKNTASRVWENIKKAMTSPVEDAKKTISRTIDKIKGFFSRLQLKLPEIQLPRLPSFELKFSSKTIFGKTFSYPSGFDIGWHASGGIFTGPSVIGVGEAGDEAVVPLSNKSRMAPFAKAVADFMKEENVGSSGASGATVKQPIVLRNTIEVDGREFLFQVKEYIQEVIDEYTELQERKLGNI